MPSSWLPEKLMRFAGEFLEKAKASKEDRYRATSLLEAESLLRLARLQIEHHIKDEIGKGLEDHMFEVQEVSEYKVGEILVKHQFSKAGAHRLIVGAIEGRWTNYTMIAMCAGLCATTDYYQGVFPILFRVEDLSRFKV